MEMYGGLKSSADYVRIQRFVCLCISALVTAGLALMICVNMNKSSDLVAQQPLAIVLNSYQISFSCTCGVFQNTYLLTVAMQRCSLFLMPP